MLSIRNKQPWVFWPTRVCPSFFELSGNQIITGKYNFKLEIDFTLIGVYGDKSTIFSILPIYTAFNYYNEHMSNIDIHTEDGMKWTEIKDIVSLGKRHKIILENVDKILSFYIDSKKIIEVQNFSHINDPQLVLGAGNFPWHNENHHYCDLDLHEFKLYHNEELISHHLFDKFIYEKSYDLTDNCNFIHKI
jgi:hypothetical protein